MSRHPALTAALEVVNAHRRTATEERLEELRETFDPAAVELNDRQEVALRYLAESYGREGRDYAVAGFVADRLMDTVGPGPNSRRPGSLRANGWNAYPTLKALESRGLARSDMHARDFKYGDPGHQTRWRATDLGIRWLAFHDGEET